MRCKNCGHDNAEGERHCTACRFPLPPTERASGAKPFVAPTASAEIAPTPPALGVEVTGARAGSASPVSSRGRKICPQCRYELVLDSDICPMCSHHLGKKVAHARSAQTQIKETPRPRIFMTPPATAEAEKSAPLPPEPKQPEVFRFPEPGPSNPGPTAIASPPEPSQVSAVFQAPEPPAAVSLPAPPELANVPAPAEAAPAKKAEIVFMETPEAAPLPEPEAGEMFARPAMQTLKPGRRSLKSETNPTTSPFNAQRKPRPANVRAGMTATIDPFRSDTSTGMVATLQPVAREGEPKQEALVVAHLDGPVPLNRAMLDPENNTITGKVQAELEYRDGAWYILDRSEQQTTFVRATGPVQLQKGDIILMGNRKFEFDC